MLCLCQSLFYLAKKKNLQYPQAKSKKNVLATLVPPTGIFPSVKALPGPQCSPFSVLFNNSQVVSCLGSSEQRPLNNQTLILLTVAYYQRRMSQSTKFVLNLPTFTSLQAYIREQPWCTRDLVTTFLWTTPSRL